jgi:hypothetical protein
MPANDSAIIGRMIFKLEKSLPKEEKVTAALIKISMWIVAKAKIIARRKRIVDRGHLINSLDYEMYRVGNTYGTFVGSFGVRYAAMNEFGGPVSREQMRAMFKAMKIRGVRLAGKGVIVKSGPGFFWRERPFLRPAVIESQKFILDTLRKEL